MWVCSQPLLGIQHRLDLETYKATIKGLTRFGDRRQGTKRNREAIDWIEAELKRYGCSNTERITRAFGGAGFGGSGLASSPAVPLPLRLLANY